MTAISEAIPNYQRPARTLSRPTWLYPCAGESLVSIPVRLLEHLSLCRESREYYLGALLLVSVVECEREPITGEMLTTVRSLAESIWDSPTRRHVKECKAALSALASCASLSVPAPFDTLDVGTRSVRAVFSGEFATAWQIGGSFRFPGDVLRRLGGLLGHPSAFRVACQILRSHPTRFGAWALGTWYQRHVVGHERKGHGPVRKRTDVCRAFDAVVEAKILATYTMLPLSPSGCGHTRTPKPMRLKIVWCPESTLPRVNETEAARVYKQIPIGFVYEYFTTAGTPRRIPSHCHCMFNPSSHRNNDRHPSVSLWNDKGIYHCHACGASGNTYQLARFLLNRGRRSGENIARASDMLESGREMFEAFQEWQSSSGKEHTLAHCGPFDVEKAYGGIKEALAGDPSRLSTAEYVRSLGLSNAEMEELGMLLFDVEARGHLSNWVGKELGLEAKTDGRWTGLFMHPERSQGLVVWPWWRKIGDESSITGILVRTGAMAGTRRGNRYRWLGEQCIYNIDGIADADRVFLTEGAPDAWILRSHGFTVCALPTMSSERQLKAEAGKFHGKTVVMCLDHDQGMTQEWLRKTSTYGHILTDAGCSDVLMLDLPEGLDVREWVHEMAGSVAGVVESHCMSVPEFDDVTSETSQQLELPMADKALIVDAMVATKEPVFLSPPSPHVRDSLWTVALDSTMLSPSAWCVDASVAEWLIGQLRREAEHLLVVPDAKAFAHAVGFGTVRNMALLSANLLIHRLRQVEPSLDFTLPTNADAVVLRELAQPAIEEARARGVLDASISESTMEGFLSEIERVSLIVDDRALSEAHGLVETTEADKRKISEIRSHAVGGQLAGHWDLHTHSNGRVACREPNLQSLPRQGQARKCLESPAGHSLVSLDFASIEMRVAAHFAGQGELFEDTTDFYLRIARELYEDATMELNDPRRGLAKAAMCALLYSASADTIGEKAGISIAQAGDLRATWASLRGVGNSLLANGRETGAITTISGRQRFVAGLAGKYSRRPHREAWNALVQGSTADIVLRKALSVHDAGLPAQPALLIHDEIVYVVRDDDIAKTVGRLVDLMERDEPDLTVPLVVRVKIGKDYGSLVDWESATTSPAEAKSDGLGQQPGPGSHEDDDDAYICDAGVNAHSSQPLDTMGGYA
jgi:hypothetical protein